MLENYLALAQKAEGVSFLGRLGTYRYLDMDVTIAEALAACEKIDQHLAEHSALPSFFVNPL